MIRIKKIAFLILIVGCRCCKAMDPFPVAQLDSEVLSYFYPQIMEEVDKEFVYQNDERTQRNTREYGYSFFKMENGDFSYNPPPEFLNALGEKICQSLGHPPQEFTNVILSLYEAGFHLEPHIDINSFDNSDKDYYFDEKVYGIIIETDATGHLYFICDKEPIYSLEEKPGVVFCMQGAYRKSPYCHGVSPISKRRISITFRKVVLHGND